MNSVTSCLNNSCCRKCSWQNLQSVYCLTLSSWSLRTTKLEWKNCTENSGKFRAKTVSFIRLGRPHKSKSTLINDILSENKHDTFFNLDCPQGEKQFNRMLTIGSIEMTWYLPQVDEENILSQDETRIHLRDLINNCCSYQCRKCSTK